MMIGEIIRPSPIVQIPMWDPYDDPPPVTSFPGAHSPPASYDYSPSADYAAAFHRYLPSNADGESELLFDSLSSDDFRMYDFKVRRCLRGRSHDWTECPFAHPGEKARRRDPRRFHYSGTVCPDFRKGGCRKGDSCEFAHGVFESWLHPTRYRTQPCKDGSHCKRRICFFAHSPEQLRVMPPNESLPERSAFSESPPMSPPYGSEGSFNSVGELVGAMRGLQVGNLGTSLSSPPCSSWRFGFGSGSGSVCSSGFSSPGSSVGFGPGAAGCCSHPSTPTQIGAPTRIFDSWNLSFEEEPARIYSKLRVENSVEAGEAAGSNPDLGWIFELVQ